MGLVSRGKNASDSVGKLKGGDSEFALDLRLGRQWKRRGLNLGLGSSSRKALKKTVNQSNGNNDAPVEAVNVDSDYDKYLNYWERNLDFDVVGGTDARCMYYSDDGGGGDNIKGVPDADYIVVLDNLKKGGKWCVDYAGGSNDEDNFSDVFDPHYLMFLNHLKKDGKSYVLELASDNSDNKTSIVVKYENPETVLRNNLGRKKCECSRRVQRSTIGRKKLESWGRGLGSNSRRQKTKSPRLTSRSNLGTRQTESPRKVIWSNSRGRKTECFRETLRSQLKRRSNEGMSELSHESLLEFMKFVKDGQHMVYVRNNGKEVAYLESDSDSEVVVLDHNPFSDENDTLFVAIGDEDCREIITRSSQYEFREKLKEILQKPYDRKECNRRRLEASCRKPLEHDGERLDSDGKSYLDYYPDLAALIEQAHRDKPRILNLLRGLFYYLQNLSHEGQFKPWLDSECLSILPPT
ncbi:hypothetical protein AB3S75_014275 [Citrus x aurantiifolia]